MKYAEYDRKMSALEKQLAETYALENRVKIMKKIKNLEALAEKQGLEE